MLGDVTCIALNIPIAFKQKERYWQKESLNIFKVSLFPDM